MENRDLLFLLRTAGGKITAKLILILAIAVVAAPILTMAILSFTKSASRTIKLPSPFASDKLKVEEPLPGTIVKSPLEVKGEAVGTWYFEAVFPVRITDANGNILGQAQARAQSDWETADFVPFVSDLEFATPTTPGGFLVFQNDNPSGNPATLQEEKFPVVFSR